MKIKKFIKDNKFLISLVVFFVTFSLFAVNFLLVESDYYWHIKTGEYMINNKTILNKDIFSWIVPGTYWMSHEWLFEVLISFLKNVFGSLHIPIYIFITFLGINISLLLCNKKNYLKNIYFTIFYISLSLILFNFLQVRPHMISYIFIIITLYLSFDLFNNKNSKKIYYLLLLSVLWSNFHGGSSNLVYIIPLIFMITGLFNFKFKKIEASRISKTQIKRYLFVSILSLLLISINPHGFSMITYPYVNMMDNVMISTISEWQPTVLSKKSHYFFFAILLVIVFTMLFSSKKIKLIDFMLLGFSAFLGLKSIRFWPFIYIFSTFYIFNYIPNKKESRVLINLLYGLSIFFIIFTGLNYKNINLERMRLSPELISVIKESGAERLFNMYNFGGELINNQIEVFIDGRADLYSKHNLKDYVDISKLNKGSIKLLDKYDFDYLLVDNNYPIYNYLQDNSDYELIYKEKSIFYYKKKKN